MASLNVVGEPKVSIDRTIAMVFKAEFAFV
jgi:hypothetical protein